jgi:hypothetical protein
MTLKRLNMVDMPESGVIVRKIGDYRPVYKNVRSYRNAHGTPTKDRVCIGKLDEESGKLIPNAAYWEHYSHGPAMTLAPVYESVRHAGASFIVACAMSRLGLVEVLDEVLGEERSKLARTAALYMLARGNAFEGVDDYCEAYTLSEAPLSSQKASKLFASITYDERMDFFKRWTAKHPPDSCLAYDVTSFSTCAKGVVDSEHGYNRGGDRLPQINLGCYAHQSTGVPAFYVTYPGSIVDKSHLRYMTACNDELGIANVGFVLDRGFCSTANVKHMAERGYDFIIGVEKRHKAARMAIDLTRGSIANIRNRIEPGVFAVASKGYFYGTAGTMHIYHDRALADAQMDALVRSIEDEEYSLRQKRRMTYLEAKRHRTYFSIELAENGTFKYERDNDKIELASRNRGFFCLLTNTPLDSSQVLAKFRRKDVIEKNFDDLKNYISMKRMRTHNTETTDGKLFCAFIGLIVASEIETRLGEFLRKKSMSKAGLIREMEKICVATKNGDRRLMNPLTRTQRKLMEEIGVGEAELNDYINAK